MLTVSSNISERFKMEEVASHVEDLEDGEIESDGDDTTEVPKEENKEATTMVVLEEKSSSEKIQEEYRYSKSGKKKKSKSHKGEQKYKDKKKNRKYGSPSEDDFAGNVEKAIRKVLNKTESENPLEEIDERKKSKKRKKYDNKDAPGKKRKKQEFNDDMDESEMMCIRGASPVQHNSSGDIFENDDRDSYASDTSNDSRGHFHNRLQRRRPSRDRNNKGNNKNDRRRGAHPMQDPDGVCLYFMQGKCHKGDDCVYSHDAEPPRKMELCKFYLMDCCAKRDKCLYMHSDFPCKYYHTGLPCLYKDECKFAHGIPLTETLKNILLKHIESAPKEILGDFPRLSREGALKMIHATQTKLIQQYPDCFEKQEKFIPSLFEINIPPPNNIQSDPSNFTNLYNDKNKISPKIRHSRWQNDDGNLNFNANLSPNSNSMQNTNVLNIKNLTGVLTPRQISDLSKMGIENLEQLGQLTVLQLNSIGISLKQITEIQLNTMSIQKLGLIGSNKDQQQFFNTTANNKDLDLRVPPVVPVSTTAAISTESLGKDVDMRFQTSTTAQTSQGNKTNKDITHNTPKDMIDIDQYTKDALKFISKDKENIDVSNDVFENDKTGISNETKDVDHRVLPFCEENPVHSQPVSVSNSLKPECDTDIRFLQPDPIFKNPEKRNRRSTTDDEDNNLLIDEKWYSSDEEKSNKKSKSPSSSPQPASIPSQSLAPHVIEPSANIISKLGDLSKIDISEEVTKLLNTMKNNLHESKSEMVSSDSENSRLRDPRSRKSPVKSSDNQKSDKKVHRVSIYECIDGEPTDGRRRSDVDLRSNMPAFGDTDLRQSTSGDIDLRLGLPFKAIPNYTPASEIDGSINSHPPIPYKLVSIDIPRPDYTAIRDSTAKSQALIDPRLRKVFRLSTDDSNSDSEKHSKVVVSTAPRVDPRRKPKDAENTPSQDLKQNLLDIQTILQNSSWYKELSSTQKIFVNQNLAPVTQMIKQYQAEKVMGKKFDFNSIHSNSILCSIFTNLGVSISDTGEFSHVPKPKEALLKTPVSFNQAAANPFMSMEGNNMNMMNMPPMGMGSVNNMHGFNQTFPERGGPAPGLLGIAPNMPHNYNNNFNGPNNFQNMGFNGPNSGPGNDFNYMDGEQNYQRFPNRGGHRGRGNDRWNRGGSGRGQRRNDRGHWKNDRH